MHSEQFGKSSTLCAATTPSVAPVGIVLIDCIQAMNNLEGLLYNLEAKLFGARPVDVPGPTKNTQDPPIESRCRELHARLCAAVKFAESLSDKL